MASKRRLGKCRTSALGGPWQRGTPKARPRPLESESCCLGCSASRAKPPVSLRLTIQAPPEELPEECVAQDPFFGVAGAKEGRGRRRQERQRLRPRALRLVQSSGRTAGRTLQVRARSWLSSHSGLGLGWPDFWPSLKFHRVVYP